MASILLFNVNDIRKKTAIYMTARKFGIDCRDISTDHQIHTIETLLNVNELPKMHCDNPFTDEMMVMDLLTGAVFHDFLDTLRKDGNSIRLKAVVTDHNRNWNAIRLYHEISAEASAIENRRRR